VDETGRYIGEEYSLALAAKLILAKKPGVAVTNLSSSRMLDDIAAANNGQVIRTPVGEANVVKAMIGHNAAIAARARRVIDTRISPAAIAGRHRLCAPAHGRAQQTISQLVAEIPAMKSSKPNSTASARTPIALWKR